MVVETRAARARRELAEMNRQLSMTTGLATGDDKDVTDVGDTDDLAKINAIDTTVSVKAVQAVAVDDVVSAKILNVSNFEAVKISDKEALVDIGSKEGVIDGGTEDVVIHLVRKGFVSNLDVKGVLSNLDGEGLVANIHGEGVGSNLARDCVVNLDGEGVNVYGKGLVSNLDGEVVLTNLDGEGVVSSLDSKGVVSNLDGKGVMSHLDGKGEMSHLDGGEGVTTDGGSVGFTIGDGAFNGGIDEVWLQWLDDDMMNNVASENELPLGEWSINDEYPNLFNLEPKNLSINDRLTLAYSVATTAINKEVERLKKCPTTYHCHIQPLIDQQQHLLMYLNGASTVAISSLEEFEYLSKFLQPTDGFACVHDSADLDAVLFQAFLDSKKVFPYI